MTDNVYSYAEKNELRQRSSVVLREAQRFWRGIDIAKMLNVTPQMISNVKAGRQYFVPAQLDLLMNKLKEHGVTQETLPLDTTITQSQNITVSNSATKYGALRFRDALMKNVLASDMLEKHVKTDIIQLILETPLDFSD